MNTVDNIEISEKRKFGDVTSIKNEDLITTSEVSPYYWKGEIQTQQVNHDKLNEYIKDKYTLVDLFCGAGGLSKGFEMTERIVPILGVDIFKPAMDTYRLNHPKTNTILGDMRQVSNEQLRAVTQGCHVNIIAAGVPCQGFSLSNKKRVANDARNFLFLEVIRTVNELNPDVVVIENVSGMKSLENGQFIDVISGYLENAGSENGYNVKADFLNAADFGVPQLRKRLFFVAVKKSLGTFEFPEGSYGATREKIYNTIRDAIGDLPMIEAGEECEEYLDVELTPYQKQMRGNKKTIQNHKAPKHPKETIQKIAATKPGEPMYEKYKQRIRLAWEMQSPTQLAGGIRPQFQFGHPEVNRGLTVRERARIQSFPDEYVFMGGTVQGRVQTGNAVPPLLAKGLADKIVKLLDDKLKKGEENV